MTGESKLREMVAAHSRQTCFVSLKSEVGNGARILSGSDDCSLRVCDMNEEEQEFIATMKPITSLTVEASPSSSIVYAAMISFAKDKVRKKSGNHKNPITTLKLQPDGGLLASGDQDGNVSVWNVQRRLVLFFSTGSRIMDVTFSPLEPMIYVSSAAGAIRSYDFITQRLRIVQAPNCRSLALSADGEDMYLSNEDGHIGLWSL
ncbi:hypothetical protein C2857_005089 [Epichloe festucae Fl1]|uniref:Uncharacterized protein n=1 Tax=Epichloe festucae (strain Fl1) TaxID=877507 RepID=A0A7S9KV40_EPIFF|nr:hypothetical protein C2857_005089 [Epichloe festucae Fl1]